MAAELPSSRGRARVSLQRNLWVVFSCFPHSYRVAAGVVGVVTAAALAADHRDWPTGSLDGALHSPPDGPYSTGGGILGDAMGLGKTIECLAGTMVRETLHAHAEAVRKKNAAAASDADTKARWTDDASKFSPRGRTTLIVSPSECETTPSVCASALQSSEQHTDLAGYCEQITKCRSSGWKRLSKPASAALRLVDTLETNVACRSSKTASRRG